MGKVREVWATLLVTMSHSVDALPNNVICNVTKITSTAVLFKYIF